MASAGDVNGDGYDDVIVGAPYLANPTDMEGRVYVFLGSATGLGTSPVWTAESNLEEAMLGSSVGSAGDVNGDGYDDIIVGAYTYSNGQQGEGAAFIWFGSATGLGPNGTPANADWMVEGNQIDAAMGTSVDTAGDVNNDGYDDVIVGAPGYNNKGVAFVYYGSASGLSTTPSWTAEPNQACSFSYSVSTAGDVNGDGYDDIIIGAPAYWNSTYTSHGAAFVYYGSASGLSTSANWRVEDIPGDTRLGAAVAVAWSGGTTTAHQVTCPPLGWHCVTDANLVQRIREMATTCPDHQIAEHLNAEGVRTQTGKNWTYERVHSIRKQHHIPTCCPIDPTVSAPRGDGLVSVKTAAQLLQISPSLVVCTQKLSDG